VVQKSFGKYRINLLQKPFYKKYIQVRSYCQGMLGRSVLTYRRSASLLTVPIVAFADETGWHMSSLNPWPFGVQD